MALNYVCKFNNLMFTPIRITPKCVSEEEKDPLKDKDKDGADSFESEVISGDSQMEDENQPLASDKRKSVPRLNLEKAGDNESTFKLELNLAPQLDYEATIDFQMLRKMTKNKTIGF